MLGRVGAIGAAPEHGQGGAARRERGAVGRRVDAAREAAQHGDAFPRHAARQKLRHAKPVGGRPARADDGEAARPLATRFPAETGSRVDRAASGAGATPRPRSRETRSARAGRAPSRPRNRPGPPPRREAPRECRGASGRDRSTRPRPAHEAPRARARASARPAAALRSRSQPAPARAPLKPRKRTQSPRDKGRPARSFVPGREEKRAEPAHARPRSPDRIAGRPPCL